MKNYSDDAQQSAENERELYVRLAHENAKRFYRDALELRKVGSWKSAAILAVFAIEESGKALIEQWGVRNSAARAKFPTHSEKHAAFFALLSGHEHTKNDNLMLREGRGTKIREVGPHSEQMLWARHGFYDNLRKICTYSDRDPIWPSIITENINEGMVDDLLSVYAEFVDLLANKEAVGFGKILYENDFGLL